MVRAQVLFLVLLLSIFHGFPVYSAGSKHLPLKDLNGLRILIENPDPESGNECLDKGMALKTVESRLKRAGLKIIGSTKEAFGQGILYLRVTTMPLQSGEEIFGYSCYAHVEVLQASFLARDRDIAFLGSTWSEGTLLAVRKDNILEPVDRAFEGLLDGLLKDHRKANPP